MDGLLLPTDPNILMESSNGSSNHLSYLHPMGVRSNSPSTVVKPAHGLLFGVTKTESPFIFTESEEKSGIDSLRRDKILYSFIKNIIDYYQEVILLSVINEYTDWSSTSESPLARLDSLIDILSDGLIVSPIMKAGILQYRHQQRRLAETTHANTRQVKTPGLNSKTFFYVFDYQVSAHISSFILSFFFISSSIRSAATSVHKHNWSSLATRSLSKFAAVNSDWMKLSPLVFALSTWSKTRVRLTQAESPWEKIHCSSSQSLSDLKKAGDSIFVLEKVTG